MEIVNPPLNERGGLDETPHQGEDFTDGIRPRPEANISFGADKSDAEYRNDVSSLLEENARLRGLVVKLSSMILKKAVNQN